MLLAIDTSAGTAVAVVDRDRGVLAERAVADRRRHAELIGPLIAEALAAAGVDPVQLSHVAVGMGPGPFTGLRVGIAAARAFAAGIRRPVIPLVSHDAVAYSAALGGRTDPLVVVTDARRREVAWSAYAAPDELGLPVRVSGPALAESAGDAGAHERIHAAEIPAGPLGLLAEALHAHGRPFGPAEAIYLRAPDAAIRAPQQVIG